MKPSSPKQLIVPIAATLAYVCAAFIMFTMLIPGVRAACGVEPLDAQFTWSISTAHALAQSCGAAGFEAYARMAAWDLVYPALLAVFLGSWTLWGARRLGLSAGLTMFSLAPIALAVIADYLENIAVWAVIRGEEIASSLFVMMGPATSVAKNVMGAVAFLIAGVLLVLAVRKTVRLKRSPVAVSFVTL